MSPPVTSTKLETRPIVLSAVDKFRGTATSRELGVVVTTAVEDLGLIADAQAMSDGGEGFIDAFEGEIVAVEVPGPLLETVLARVKLVATVSGTTAVLEVADIIGRDLLPSPTPHEALAATSEGVGHAILAVARMGVDDVLVGCGGSATSDGGLGCYRVLLAAGGLSIPLSAATDVTAGFFGARRYAEQKGVAPEDVVLVEERLVEARGRYFKDQGVDVETIERTGAAGGVPGALVALGARVTSGLEAVTSATNLAKRVARSSMVITGEGRFDAGSLEGKVTLGVAELVESKVPLLVVCGSLEHAAAGAFQRRFPHATLVSLEERFGLDVALADVVRCVNLVVRDEVRRCFSVS